MRSIKVLVTAIVSVALIGLAVSAFAHGGKRWGAGWGNYGSGYNEQLDRDQYRQFDENRQALLEETEGLRSELSEKQRELQNELSKTEPNASKASDLQREISDIQAKLDQKRIDHMIENRETYRGFRRGSMAGGGGMGYGPGGGAGCWR